MIDEVADIVRETMWESLQEYDREVVARGEQLNKQDDRALERHVRQRFLDRWYRFAPFGVESRAALEPIRVEVKWGPPRPDEPMPVRLAGGNYEEGPTRNTTVIVVGTPLEQYTPSAT